MSAKQQRDPRMGVVYDDGERVLDGDKPYLAPVLIDAKGFATRDITVDDFARVDDGKPLYGVQVR